MNDMSYYNTADNKRRNLTVRFCLAALCVTSLIVLAMTVASHYQLRAQAMGVDFEELAVRINRDVLVGVNMDEAVDPAPQLISFWALISQLQGVQKGAFFDLDRQLI